VDFSFSEEQVAFRDAVRVLLDAVAGPDRVRAAWAGGPGWDAVLWRRLADMGVLGLLAPPGAGGLGLSELDLILVLEESGRAALPGPLVEHAAVAIPLLAGAGCDGLVAEAAAGGKTVTFSDRATRVGWAAEADAAVVLDGGRARLLHRADVSVISTLACVDGSRRDAAVAWTGGELLAGVDVALALDRAALGAAAQLCGLAARLVELTVAYVTERRQFGVPIGSYQAVKHHLADALLALEHARPTVYRAAWSVARDLPTRARDVSTAKAMAGDAAGVAARVALQCHGAIGYTWESDLHLWMKRVWVLERAWGDSAAHRARVADALLGAQAGGNGASAAARLIP